MPQTKEAGPAQPGVAEAAPAPLAAHSEIGISDEVRQHAERQAGSAATNTEVDLILAPVGNPKPLDANWFQRHNNVQPGMSEHEGYNALMGKT